MIVTGSLMHENKKPFSQASPEGAHVHAILGNKVLLFLIVMHWKSTQF